VPTDDFAFRTTEFEFKGNGFADLYKSIRKLEEGVLAKELTPLLVRASEPVRVYAQTLAPDDPKSPNPDLESGIAISTRQRSGRAKRDRQLGKYDARVFIGPFGGRSAYPQAIMQEFGTVKMSAQPYMRPAYDSQKETVVRLLGISFGDHIQAIARKYGVR
jgi:HK97 gp10 family phage protein